jgi:hypothetical protein
MRVVTVLMSVVAITLALQQGQAQTPEKPMNVSLCEVKAHPENFLHKLIEITVTASHGFEDSMIEDSRCPWASAGPGVWMEYGGGRSTNTMYCCGLSPRPDREQPLIVEGVPLELVDDQTFREFDKQLHPKHSKPQRRSDKVTATMRGRMFARYEGIMGTQQSFAWRGYGHMDCCMLFVVTQVLRVEPPR